MKRRLAVEPLERPPAWPLTVESLRKRRWWLVVALTVINASSVLNGIQQVVTWPNSASLFLSAEQVTVRRDTEGNAQYEVRVPLKEFPYDTQLGQQHRHELLACATINLLLLLAILHSYRRQAKLERTHAAATGS